MLNPGCCEMQTSSPISSAMPHEGRALNRQPVDGDYPAGEAAPQEGTDVDPGAVPRPHAEQSRLRDLQAGTTIVAALAFYDRLGPVGVEEMIGSWRGEGLPTGNPLDGLLERFGWYGKRFDGPDGAHPLVFDAGAGPTMLLNPAFVPIAALIRYRWLLRAPFVPVCSAYFARCSPRTIRRLDFGSRFIVGCSPPRCATTPFPSTTCSGRSTTTRSSAPWTCAAWRCRSCSSYVAISDERSTQKTQLRGRA